MRAKTYYTSYEGDSPQLELCAQIQQYYKYHSIQTQVLVAALKSIEEVMVVSGVQHMTLAPPLLRDLHETSKSSSLNMNSSLMDEECRLPLDLGGFSKDEASYRMRFTRSNEGRIEQRLIQVRQPRLFNFLGTLQKSLVL